MVGALQNAMKASGKHLWHAGAAGGNVVSTGLGHLYNGVTASPVVVYNGVVASPATVAAAVKGCGQVIKWAIADVAGKSLLHVFEGAVWTAGGAASVLEGTGKAGLWTVGAIGTVVKKLAAISAIAVGYPAAIVGIGAGASALTVGAGSCLTATYGMPTLFEMVISPIASTALMLDAAVCPTFASTGFTFIGAGLTGLAIARLGHRGLG